MDQSNLTNKELYLKLSSEEMKNYFQRNKLETNLEIIINSLLQENSSATILYKLSTLICQKDYNNLEKLLKTEELQKILLTHRQRIKMLESPIFKDIGKIIEEFEEQLNQDLKQYKREEAVFVKFLELRKAELTQMLKHIKGDTRGLVEAILSPSGESRESEELKRLQATMDEGQHAKLRTLLSSKAVASIKLDLELRRPKHEKDKTINELCKQLSQKDQTNKELQKSLQIKQKEKEKLNTEINQLKQVFKLNQLMKYKIYLPEIAKFFDIIQISREEWFDKSILYQVKIKKIFQKCEYLLDVFIQSAFLKSQYKQFCQQTIINLIQYQSFQVRLSLGSYKIIENSLKNSEKLSRLKASQKIKLRQKQNQQLFEKDKKYLWETPVSYKSFQQSLKKTLKQTFKLKSMLILYKKYSIEQFFSVEVQALSSEKQLHLQNKEAQNYLNIITSFLEQQSKMISFLIIKIIDMIFSKDKQQSKEQIFNMLYLVVFIKSIRQLLSSSPDIFYISSTKNLAHCYSLIIAKNSSIRQFPNSKINLETQQITSYDNNCQIRQFIKAYTSQKSSFYSYFGLDILNFLKDIYINGISFQITPQRFVINKQRIVYILSSPIKIEKKIEQLEEINPKLASILSEMKSNKQKLKKQQFSFDQIYDEDNIIFDHINQLKSINKNLMIISEVIQQILQYHQKQLKQILKLIKSIKINEQLLENTSEKLKSLINHQYSQNNKQNLEGRINNGFNIIKSIQQSFLQNIDMIIYKWNKLFPISQEQQLQTQPYHLRTIKTSCPVQKIFENLFKAAQKSIQETPSQDSTPKQIKQEETPGQKLSENKSLQTPGQDEKVEHLYTTLKNIAKKLTLINKVKFTGIQSVQFICENHIGYQIHLQCISRQKTVVFADLSHVNARKMFFRLFLPHLPGKDTQEFRKFILYSQSDLQNVIKTFLFRFNNAFSMLKDLSIKSSLFLLRHLMIDNKLNSQNYPNLVPRLNIIQCIIDSTISNKIYRTNFIQEFYLNTIIKQLNLSLKDHNLLVQTVFLLSLIEDSQSMFLRRIIDGLSKKNIKSSNIKVIIENVFTLFNYDEKDHPYFYLENIHCEDLTIKIFKNQAIKLIKNNLNNIKKQIDQISSYFFNQQQVQKLNLQDQPLNKIYQQGDIIFCDKYLKQITYFTKKIYQLNQSIYSSQCQQFQLNKNLLKLMYCNMKQIYQCYKQNRHRFTSLKPIIFLKSFITDENCEYMHFLTITQTINFSAQKFQQQYNKYFLNNELQLDIIRSKCLYYQNLSLQERQIFSNQLYKIPGNAKQLGFQLLNINIFTVQFVISYELEPEQMPNKFSGFTNKFKPIFCDYSFSCFIGSKQPIRKQNSKRLANIFSNHQKALKIQNAFIVINFPYQFHELFLNLYDKQLFYSIGQIGFIECLLTFCNDLFTHPQQNHYFPNQHIFLQFYLVKKSFLVKNNFEDYAINEFVEELDKFISQLYPQVSKKLRQLLLKSIHPKKTYRLKISKIKSKREKIRKSQIKSGLSSHLQLNEFSDIKAEDSQPQAYGQSSQMSISASSLHNYNLDQWHPTTIALNNNKFLKSEEYNQALFLNSCEMIKYVQRSTKALVIKNIAKHICQKNIIPNCNFQVYSQKGVSFRNKESIWQLGQMYTYQWVSDIALGISQLQSLGIYNSDIQYRNTIGIFKQDCVSFKIIDFDRSFKVIEKDKNDRNFQCTKKLLNIWINTCKNEDFIRYIFAGADQPLIQYLFTIKRGSLLPNRRVDKCLKQLSEHMEISHLKQYSSLVQQLIKPQWQKDFQLIKSSQVMQELEELKKGNITYTQFAQRIKKYAYCSQIRQKQKDFSDKKNRVLSEKVGQSVFKQFI